MKEHSHSSQRTKLWARAATSAFFVAGLCLTTFCSSAQGQDDEGVRVGTLVRAEQPPAPCTANETAAQDVATTASRGDIAQLPEPLETRQSLMPNVSRKQDCRKEELFPPMLFKHSTAQIVKPFRRGSIT